MATNATVSVPELLKEHGERIARYLEEVLARYTDAPGRLMESIRYSLLAGGKRLRPALVLESFRACSPVGSDSGLCSALAAAGAIELIHTFSLVHDDLPAMDDDDLRRGVPTNHKVFGEAMAILAGDAMVTMAFEVLARDAEPQLAGRLIAELAEASGPGGMIGGQVLDIEGEGKKLSLDQLQQLHRKKTGALLRCACRMGAMAAGVSDEVLDRVTLFGQHLGLAFQIVDDLLDVTATAEELGKGAGKDAGKGKNTYPVLLSIEGSRKAAEEQLGAAMGALEGLGEQAGRLRDLARFVVERRI